MLGYTLRRVLLIIPTVLLIAILSFLLQTLTPGDIVADRLTVEGTSIFSSQEDYNKAYRRLENQMGLDRPAFYFSVQPSYFPDTLYRIVPKQKREFFSALLRQTKDWNSIKSFHEAQLSLQQELMTDPKTNKKLLVIANRLSSAGSLSDLQYGKGELEKIRGDFKQNEVIGLTSLIDAISRLETKRKFSWPTFRWHGFSNQCHFWITNLFSSDNVSIVDGTPVFDKLTRALGWTVSIGLVSLILIAIFSLLLAYLQVYFEGSWFDKIISWVWYFLLAMPTFWFATLMVVFFTTPEYGAWTDVFPSIGVKPSFVEQSLFQELMANASQLVLPILCITVLSLAYLTIQTKSDLKRVVSQSYFKTSRARGLSWSKQLKAHALPNALITYITILSGAIPFIITGSVIIEVIFNIPGVGRLLLYSIQYEDWPIVFALVVMISIVTIVGFIIGDLLLMWLYPRTKASLSSSAVDNI